MNLWFQNAKIDCTYLDFLLHLTCYQFILHVIYFFPWTCKEVLIEHGGDYAHVYAN